MIIMIYQMLLKMSLTQLDNYLGELNEKYIALNKLFILSNIKLAISNTNRDIGSMLSRHRKTMFVA